jgi:peroxiredoxin
VLGVGERIPDVTLRTPTRGHVRLRELGAGGAVLLVFYLFDFSST